MPTQHDSAHTHETSSHACYNEMRYTPHKGGVTLERVPTQRTPIISLRAFVEAHVENDCRLKAYLNRNRRNSVRLSDDARAELRPEAMKFLCANNIAARIGFAKVVERCIHQLIDAKSTEFAWITLTPKQFALSEAASLQFEVSRIQAWTREVLRSVDFFGWVDAALYTNVGNVMARINRTVSWHSHLLAWDTEAILLKELRKMINDRYDSVVPGAPTMHFAMVEGDEILEKVWYMLKAPQSEYRIYPMKETVVDEVTGEVLERTLRKFKQRKRAMRTGDLVRMYEVMAGRQLDQLSFGNGEGKAFHQKVRQHALRPLERALEKYRGWGRAKHFHVGCRPYPGAPLV